MDVLETLEYVQQNELCTFESSEHLVVFCRLLADTRDNVLGEDMKNAMLYSLPIDTANFLRQELNIVCASSGAPKNNIGVGDSLRKWIQDSNILG